MPNIRVETNDPDRREAAQRNRRSKNCARKGQEDAQYKAFIEQRVNQDSVFSNPEYQMLLYKELFPEDKTIKPEDLELFRVERILTMI